MITRTYQGYQGVTLRVGDRVTLATFDGAESIPIALGSAGRIAGNMGGNDDYTTIEWDVEHRSLHAGDGTLRRDHAWDVRPKCLSLEKENPMDSAMQSLVEAIDKTGQYLVIGGTIFELQETAMRAPSELIRKRDSQVVYTFQQKLAEIKSVEANLRAKYEQMLLMPNLSIADIGKGIRCYSDGCRVHILKEILYEPMTIHRGGCHKRLRDEDIAGLRRKVIADVTIPDFLIILRDALSLRAFSHYHSMGSNDCTGTIDVMQFYDGPKETIVARAVKFIDAIESLFKVINMDDLAAEHPSGLRKASELYSLGATTGEIEGVLVSQPVPIIHNDDYDEDEDEDREREPELDSPMFEDGDEVEITASVSRAGIRPGMHGVICGDHDEWSCDDGWCYAVQLDDRHDGRRSCGGRCPDETGFYLYESQMIRFDPHNHLPALSVGDTVIVTRNQGAAHEGAIGIIRDLDNEHSNANIAVEFLDSNPGFHDCNNEQIPAMHGYYIDIHNLQPYSPERELVVGDKIIMIQNHDSAKIGDIGTIVSITSETYGVDFENVNPIDFHTCDGMAREGHGHWVLREDIARHVPVVIAPTPRLLASEIEQGILSI